MFIWTGGSVFTHHRARARATKTGSVADNWTYIGSWQDSRYAYTAGNPVDALDPSGLGAWCLNPTWDFIVCAEGGTSNNEADYSYGIGLDIGAELTWNYALY